MEDKVKKLQAELDVSYSVADELLRLSGGDMSLAISTSRESQGLNQCKANIIDRRFKRLEKKLDD